MGCNRCNRTSCRCSTTPLRYTGPDIDCVGVLQNDTFETVVRKLTDYVCDISFEDGVGIANILFNEGDCTITIVMTNGVTYNTESLCGEDGQGIDHTSFTSSTGGGVVGEPGETDTYTVWGDVGETINLGTFEVYNGTNAPAEGDTVFHKVYDIGVWDMINTASVIIPLALGFGIEKVVGIQVIVYDDAMQSAQPLTSYSSAIDGKFELAAGSMVLVRESAGFFTNPNYSSTLINRGKILIHYVP